MEDRRRQLGGFAVLALVLLRLVTGWHFFSEGLEKIERDPVSGRYHLSSSFTAATTGFLSAAKGPLADFYHSFAPNGHDWQRLLAVPHQNKTVTAEDAKAAAERDPSHDWAERVTDDWQAILSKATAVPSLTEDQVERAKAAYERRKQELADYLAGEKDAIAEYQHELWRLDRWRAEPEADGAPFQEEQIAKKASETAAKAKAWVAGVAELEDAYVADLRQILTPDNGPTAATAGAVDQATTPPQQTRLQQVELATAALTIGVGICLLLGLFTRLASIAGALFLLSVVATQPPWLPNAEPTIYQSVELAGLLVLAGTGAGRWLGLDFFPWALFHRTTND